MAFHESFWVVTGTAAPVIALAAIVSLADADREFIGFLMTNLANMRRISPYMKPLALIALVIAVSGILNLLLQATLLATSLVSLAEDVNSVPPWFAVTMAVGGLMLLVVGAWGAVSLHVQNQLLAKVALSKTTTEPPPPGTDADYQSRP